MLNGAMLESDEREVRHQFLNSKKLPKLESFSGAVKTKPDKYG